MKESKRKTECFPDNILHWVIFITRMQEHELKSEEEKVNEVEKE